MGRYYCSIKKCKYFEDGIFENIYMCNEDCIANQARDNELVCHDCMAKRIKYCQNCDEERCTFCLEPGSDMCMQCWDKMEEEEEKRLEDTTQAPQEAIADAKLPSEVGASNKKEATKTKKPQVVKSASKAAGEKTPRKISTVAAAKCTPISKK